MSAQWLHSVSQLRHGWRSAVTTRHKWFHRNRGQSQHRTQLRPIRSQILWFARRLRMATTLSFWFTMRRPGCLLEVLQSFRGLRLLGFDLAIASLSRMLAVAPSFRCGADRRQNDWF